MPVTSTESKIDRHTNGAPVLHDIAAQFNTLDLMRAAHLLRMVHMDLDAAIDLLRATYDLQVALNPPTHVIDDLTE
ncbi:hypothetical protein [Planctomicrobium piriforme]|uniref:Uncharacterized protein n=1 Tax=Planctomicrobium piriforme TaxID=1576369 RepID=A0A1I3EII8_9PLAN|nr:hypothetical protein [Planctomicrobium piriforme]SFH98805.1 hypothetical protein SAMN05421753_104239 [Planctomicrobium piriforme]